MGNSTPAASFPHRVLPALVSPLTPTVHSPRSPAPCPEQTELLRRVSRTSRFPSGLLPGVTELSTAKTLPGLHPGHWKLLMAPGLSSGAHGPDPAPTPSTASPWASAATSPPACPRGGTSLPRSLCFPAGSCGLSPGCCHLLSKVLRVASSSLLSCYLLASHFTLQTHYLQTQIPKLWRKLI